MRKSLGQIKAVNQHRVILGEVIPVVIEHPQVEPRNLGIGRIDVHDVELPRGDGFVRQPVINADRRLRQRIAPLQTAPSVIALQELMAQAESQLRMRGKITQIRHAKALRLCMAHRQRIGVVETQRHTNAETKFIQAAIERV